MKKTLLLVAACLCLALPTEARHVPASDALKVAINFWNSHRPADVKPAARMETRTFAELDHLYVFTNAEQGFIVVAADDCVQPVLAYAFDAPFPEALHPALNFWLHGYDGQIAEAIAADYQPARQVVDQWSRLFNDPVPMNPVLLTNVAALVSTRWDQGDPYNFYCPFDSASGCQTVVGCVATAMAQIMKYWNYPSFGQGSHSYVPRTWASFGTLTADFGSTTYLWQYMPNRLFEGAFDYQKDAVAKLSYHCGVAVNMMYGCSAQGGSGAYSYHVVGAMSDYFKYDPSLHAAYRYSYSDSAWCALLDAELEAGRPIYYTGSDSTGGHAFVLDGSDTASRYHFNWGWSGYGDGFYYINNLAPGINYEAAGGNATYTFNRNQDIIKGIRPGSVEVFDTVDYYDSICSDTRYHQFRDYSLRVENMDTLLRHLDTIFRYHLKVIDMKYIMVMPNGGSGDSRAINYCPATGVTLPECSYRKANCRFLGWCRLPSGEDELLQPGTHIMLNSNRRFYAIWQDTTQPADPVAIVDAEGNSPLMLAPNPVVDHLNLSLSNASDAQVLLVDALGRVAGRYTIRGGKAKISLRHLPAGAYIVQVSNDNATYNRRIIKR